MKRIATLLTLSVIAVLGACSSDESSGGGGASGGAGGSGNAGGSSGSGGGSGASGASTGGSSGSATGGSSNGGGSGSSGSSGSTSAHDCANPHSAWLLCEDFEGMAQGFEAWRNNWGFTDHIGADNPGRMTASNDAHSGSWAVHYPAAASAGHQGADLIYRSCSGTNEPGCALDSHERLYFRTYVKLAADHERVHHFLSIAGSQQFWDAYGNAGCRPNGELSTGTTLDFEANSHETFFYTYHPDMTCDPGSSCDNYADPQAICDGCADKGMPCSNGLECCWGNHFRPDPDVALPVNQWVCVEMMMKVNDVGQSNGEMAYWIDGKLAHEVTTLRFRTTADLGLNMVRLQHYLETEDAQNHSNQVWFDDVVVSTEPIGCL